ncbi:MAG: tetratricopeptide repeat protein [Acidobacteriota bacterium]|nr:tetratricopeptide repeat protein [Acidobacteriota bacterium]
MILTKGRAALLYALFLFPPAPAVAQQEALAAKSAQAKQMMQAGRFDQAAALYAELVKAVPGNPGLLLDLGLAQHLGGHEPEAAATLEQVLKLQPDALPALVTLASAKLAMDRPAEALAPLRKALTIKPDVETRGMLANALLEAKRPEEAEAEYRKLTDAAPNDARVWYGLGMAYQAIAGKAFDQLQRGNPVSPYVSALVADTRVQRKQYRSAFFFYGEAAKQLPQLHGIHAALADLYRKTGHNDWASEEDARESALPPADCAAHPFECQFAGGHDLPIVTQPLRAPTPEALYWRAKAANELALQALFRLGQLPPSVELHQLRAEIARGQGQYLEAVAEWKAALAQMPGNPRIRQELAASYFMAQDYRAALAEAQDLLRHAPAAPELNFIAGDSLLRLEDPEKAVPYLRAALRGDPRMLAADASLGLALSRLGKHSEAAPLLEKALELDDDGSLYYQLARAYQALGSRDKAAAAMAKYQEIQKRNQEQKEEVAREAQIGPPR